MDPDGVEDGAEVSEPPTGSPGTAEWETDRQHDGEVENDGDIVPLTLPQLTRRAQTSQLPLPVQNPTLLPLADLDPEVFERVAAEVVSRRDNLGVQFYGRRGQKQYGLDIVEREKSFGRALYQARRYEELTGAKIRDAVRDYAGPARTPGHGDPKRRFNPRRFVVMTSAALDRDVGNVDALAELQDEYDGDLEIEVWGAEALSRKLRDAPNLVYSVFGPAWANAFCGFEPGRPGTTDPRPLGLVEAPVAVLGLDSLESDAAAIEDSDPIAAAHLYGVVAQGLDDGNFPGHASEMRRRQAKSAQAGGDRISAFSILFGLALDRVLRGEDIRFGAARDLDEMSPTLDPVERSKVSVLYAIAGWYEHGSDLSTTVPALQALTEARDRHAALLCCLVLEQAVVDGLYDFVPPHAILVHVDSESAATLSQLHDLAAASDSSDVVIRARLRCAVADAALPLDAVSADVDAAYGGLVDDALAGRLLHARGLVTSRAAYAFAVRGDVERADNLWRQSILCSSEDGFYGDTRAAMRASRRLAFDSGRWDMRALHVFTSALPNRLRLLAGAEDPALSAFEAAHNGSLIDALGETRRYLWESRLAGQFQEELLAQALLGDVFAAGKRPNGAVEAYVVAGDAKKAAELAATLPEAVDVTAWAISSVRRRRSAAIQVIAAQALTIRNDEVGGIVDMLLHTADGIWGSPFFSPSPEHEALKAIAKFGVRIPEDVVDAILELAGPALAANTNVSDSVADLLMQTYWAVEPRRDDLAGAIGRMLRLPDPPPNLWSLVQNMWAEARTPLRPIVLDLANEGDREAIETLADWREDSEAVQLAARRACAALLRRPVGIARGVVSIDTQATATIDLLLALLEASQLVDVDTSELGIDKARSAGGTFLTKSLTRAKKPREKSSGDDGEEGAASEGGVSLAGSSTLPSTGSTADAPDEPALIAAGPPDGIAVAVAMHLLAMVEDQLDGAASRSRAASALRRLVDRLPADVAGELAARLSDVHQNPGLSEADEFEMRTDSPFSRFHFNTGGGDLAPLALLTSAEAFRASREKPDSPVTNADRRFVDNVTASAAVLLRDDDERARQLGAVAIGAVAASSPEFAWLATSLLFHNDERVRAIGVDDAPASAQLLAALADDPHVYVRAAVARRAAQLPDAVRERLATDPNLTVRRSLARPVTELPTEPALGRETDEASPDIALDAEERP